MDNPKLVDATGRIRLKGLPDSINTLKDRIMEEETAMGENPNIYMHKNRTHAVRGSHKGRGHGGEWGTGKGNRLKKNIQK